MENLKTGTGKIMPNRQDCEILRRLGAEYAECAGMARNRENIELWKRLNGRDPVRPMVTISQICWNEFDGFDELKLRCREPEAQNYEQMLRRLIFQWRRFPADMILDPFLRVPMAVEGVGYGFETEEEVLSTDERNDVKSHRYRNLFAADGDLDKLTLPTVVHRTAESARRLAWAREVFGDVLPVRLDGVSPYVGVWDPISMWMGVEEALYAMIDRPEFMHEMIRRMVAHSLSALDQLEALGALQADGLYVHCTGAPTAELPGPDYDPARPRTRNLWMFGLAQMLSTVSPEMFDEFEIQPNLPLFERFGLVYYGCCDPLDNKMAQVKKIPHLRKISVSPWARQEVCAREIGRDYVFSRKPNPALLAFPEFSPERIQSDLEATLKLCREHGCPVELILKDISTVRNEPERLFQWEKIAMATVRAGI